MKNEAPKVFISYSRTSEDYTRKIVRIAEELRHYGVNVIFDLWHLKLGVDLYYFMEQGISTADKVLIFCDKRYQIKANNRDGGVGSETIIIAPEIYGSAVKTKFIPIIMEKNVDGEPFFPIYIQSRYGLDFVEKYEAEFEKLLRTLYNAPEYEEPPLGQPPTWPRKSKEKSKTTFEYPFTVGEKHYAPTPVFEYPTISVYDYGPFEEIDIELVGEAANQFGSYESLPANIRYVLQLVCHAIIQLWYETGNDKVFVEEKIWSRRSGNQYAVYTADMMTVINCMLIGRQIQIELFSPNQIRKVDPFIDYAKNHARMNGRIEIEAGM